MLFDPPLVSGRFVRRYKRFFVDVELDDGQVVVAHCPNTGSLLGCLEPGAPVLIQPAVNPARALRFTWKMIRVAGDWVGVDTGLAVPLVELAIRRGALHPLGDYARILREVKYGREGRSRIDLLLSRGGKEPAPGRKSGGRALPEGDERVYVEVKNTTLVEQQTALFPDAVTERGQKHLQELVHVVEQGQRAAMVFCVQRGHCTAFRPADAIDPRYAQLLREARSAGVEIYALRARAHARGIDVDGTIPVFLD